MARRIPSRIFDGRSDEFRQGHSQSVGPLEGKETFLVSFDRCTRRCASFPKGSRVNNTLTSLMPRVCINPIRSWNSFSVLLSQFTRRCLYIHNVWTHRLSLEYIWGVFFTFFVVAANRNPSTSPISRRVVKGISSSCFAEGSGFPGFPDYFFGTVNCRMLRKEDPNPSPPALVPINPSST